MRYTGWRALVLNPRRDWLCTFCGADLETGERSGLDRALQLPVVASIYLMHAFVGAGLAMLALLFVPSLFEPRWLALALLAGGAVAGLAKAELNRRRGTLLRSKPTKGA